MTQHREAIARKYTEIRALWRKHGGGQFGPRVEHVSMPEANFDGFLCDFISLFALPAPAPPPPAVEAVSDTTVKRTFRIEEGKAGVWFATSEDEPPIFVSALSEAEVITGLCRVLSGASQ